MNLNDLPDMSDALKQVQAFAEKNDGNLANNAPPYDKVTRRDVITGALGKDEMGGKRKKHDCAKKVNYKKEEWDTIPEQHTMLEDGTVTHYDITNGETILENVPVEELEILISEKHEHFDNYDKNAEVLGEADSLAAMAARREKRLARQRKQMGTSSTGQDFGHDYGISSAERKKRQQAEFDKFVGKKTKKEAFAFSEEDFEELEQFSEEIDAMSDEELIDMMEDLILETAEDDQDLIEICEHLEEVEILSEDYYASAVKASKEASKKPEVKAANRRARVERLKKAAGAAAKKVGGAVKAGAKMAGSAAKKGAKAAIGAGARAAGHAKGEFEAQRIKSKRAAMERTPAKKKEASKSSDDEGTGGKLDALLKSTRGTSSSSDGGSKSGGGGESSSSGPGILKSKKSGETRKAVGGALRKVGSLVKKGLKKAVGKTARAVSSGSDKLAKRLGEDYDQIAHLYESGLFTIQEIENVIEEGYKEIDRDKENRMYRRAGNLARTSLSAKGKAKQVAQDKSAKIVSAITRQKENERFKKMGDEKARDNYGG